MKVTHHDAKVSRIEAVLARGDRRLSKVLIEARKLGMYFDAWDEYFDYDKWMTCFEKAGIDPSFYANRHENITTPNCSEKCSACGANKLGGERTWCKRKV